jgi:type IV pilus assembly protein PilA
MTVRSRAGFTLIELMIVVAVLGLLAALAIPSWVLHVRRAKAVEAYENLKQLYNQAAVYYARERASTGMAGTTASACTVSSADNRVSPSAQKQRGDYSDPGYRALGFATALSYYRYELENQEQSAGRCLVAASTPAVYLIRARGDLDEDGARSLLELATGSNSDNELFHARSFFIENEAE